MNRKNPNLTTISNNKNNSNNNSTSCSSNNSSFQSDLSDIDPYCRHVPLFERNNKVDYFIRKTPPLPPPPIQVQQQSQILVEKELKFSSLGRNDSMGEHVIQNNNSNNRHYMSILKSEVNDYRGSRNFNSQEKHNDDNYNIKKEDKQGVSSSMALIPLPINKIQTNMTELHLLPSNDEILTSKGEDKNNNNSQISRKLECPCCHHLLKVSLISNEKEDNNVNMSSKKNDKILNSKNIENSNTTAYHFNEDTVMRRILQVREKTPYLQQQQQQQHQNQNYFLQNEERDREIHRNRQEFLPIESHINNQYMNSILPDRRSVNLSNNHETNIQGHQQQQQQSREEEISNGGNRETSLFPALPTFSPTSFVRAYVGEGNYPWEATLNNRPALIVSCCVAVMNFVVVQFLQYHVLETRDHVGLFVIGTYMIFSSYYMAYYFLERYSLSFRRISQDKKFYTIANLIKAGILVSLVPFATLHLCNIILFDIWDTNTLRNLGCIYTVPDFVSMIVVKRMSWSTWTHHLCVLLFNFFSTTNDYSQENICRCLVVYAAFSTFAYCVNVLLASRFLGVSPNVARILSCIAVVVYILCCATNWIWQVYYLRKLIKEGHDHWTVYAYMLLICLVMYDDITLNKWLLHNAKSSAFAAAQYQQHQRWQQEQQQRRRLVEASHIS